MGACGRQKGETMDANTRNNERRLLFELQAEMCRTLAHPVRLEMIDLLKDGELSGPELVEKLSLPKANVSQHLGVLRDAGLVEIRKQGVQIFAKLALAEIVDACGLVRQALASRLAADRQTSERRQNLLLASLEPKSKRAQSRSAKSSFEEEQK